MTRNETQESDWKKFCAIVPELRERYLRDRNAEWIAIFHDESMTPTEKFWKAYERMEDIKKILTSCLDDHRRSRMMDSLFLMYHHQMIRDEDLEEFSEEIRERISNLI